MGGVRLALLLLVCTLAACSARTRPPPPVLVKLAANPWDGSRLNAAIARILLSEEVGVDAEVIEIDEQSQWPHLADGGLHATLEVWPSGHGENRKAYVDTGKVEDAGLLGPTGKIGWYVPTYMLTRHPGLTSWEGLKEQGVIDVLKTSETGDKGRFLAGDPTWAQYDADIIENLGLPLKVVFAGSEKALLDELDRAYKRRDAILLYLWVPHSAHALYDLTQVQLPPYSEACYAQRETGGVDCDYPPDKLYKAVWPGLREASPRAHKLIKSLSYTTKDQIALLGMIQSGTTTVDGAARSWIDANRSTWSGWLE
jgi:glycine betaine/proline transport system substrate-binding protein